MKNKILALIITLAMVIGSFSVVYGVPADVVGTSYEEAVDKLVDLGVITGYPDGSFRPNENIRRSEYAAVAVRAKQLEEEANISQGITIFGDVPSIHWATGFINVAEEEDLINGMGIINGINTFGPERNIKYEEAVTILVRALGYETAATNSGNWPDGHLTVAAQIGLLQNINGTKGMLANRGMVAQLTYNALEIPFSGTQGPNAVYLFNDLHLINMAAANGDWSKVSLSTFADAGITGVTASNMGHFKSGLVALANGNNKNWSPSEIQGVFDTLDDPVEPVVELVKFVDGKTATVEHGTALALDVEFENTTDNNIQVAGGDVTGIIIDENGNTVPVTGLTPTTFVALKGKTVSLGTINNSIPNVGTYTIIVTAKESPLISHTGELTLEVEVTEADILAAQVVIDAIDALGSNPTKMAVQAINYAGLTANQKTLVTNYDELKVFTDDIAAGILVEGLMSGLTTNKLVEDARADYDALGALGKAEVASYANLTAAELAFSNAKTAMTNAINQAQPLYSAQKSRLDNFTPAEITNVNTNDANGFNIYQAALNALKVDLDAAKAIDLDADATTLVSITAAEGALTAEIGTFNTAKGVFDGLATVILIGK